MRMKPRNTVWPFGGLLILATMAALPARAEESPGDRVMRLMDESFTRPKDQYFVFDLVTQLPGKPESKMVFEVTIKGTQWRRLEFLAPGDMKGTRFLVRSLKQMYIYLPAYHKVRRIASHVRDQGFMGTAYSYDEMAIVTYGNVFSAELLEETPSLWKLKATRRPGQDFQYSQLEIEVQKDSQQPSAIRYYNDKGVLVKSEVRLNYTCRENACNPTEMKLIDHLRGVTSSMIRKEWKADVGAKDSFFTVRSLQKAK